MGYIGTLKIIIIWKNNLLINKNRVYTLHYIIQSIIMTLYCMFLTPFLANMLCETGWFVGV